MQHRDSRPPVTLTSFHLFCAYIHTSHASDHGSRSLSSACPCHPCICRPPLFRMFVVYIQPPPVTKGGNVSSAAAYQAVIRGRRRIVACMYHWVVCKYICKAVPNDERYSHSNSRNSKYLELCSVPKPQYMPFTPSSMAISHPHVDPALPRHPRNSIFE